MVREQGVVVLTAHDRVRIAQKPEMLDSESTVVALLRAQRMVGWAWKGGFRLR